MQENESIQIKPRRKRRSLGQIAELAREFGASRLTQRQFCEVRGIALSELQRSLKIVRRAKSAPKLLAVEVEADEQSAEAMELLIGKGYRIRIGAGFCAVTLRRLLEVLQSM
jgi:predicted nucleic acid-binding protein